MSRPTSIRIFLADGTPDGVRIIDKSNWTGRAVVASRTQLSDALQRDELTRPGVYVLAGMGDDGESRLYIGEADALDQRLRSHASKKDFWTWFVAFTSTDESLNKAYVRYLEARLITLARTANQWTVENSASPNEPPMSEADAADAEWFLNEMLLIYPILGIDAFEIAASEAAPPGGADDLVLDQRGGQGRGRETKDGFVVLAGSRARASEVPSAQAWLTDLRSKLTERGVLVEDAGTLLFTQDYRFTSPSAAAAVLVGGNANGRKVWRDGEGRTLRDIQDSRAS